MATGELKTLINFFVEYPVGRVTICVCICICVYACVSACIGVCMSACMYIYAYFHMELETGIRRRMMAMMMAMIIVTHTYEGDNYSRAVGNTHNVFSDTRLCSGC